MDKAENDPLVKASHLEIIFRLWKAKLELLTAVEKSSVCFLWLSCVNNAREAWLSLKEQYKPTTAAEEM